MMETITGNGNVLEVEDLKKWKSKRQGRKRNRRRKEEAKEKEREETGETERKGDSSVFIIQLSHTLLKLFSISKDK